MFGPDPVACDRRKATILELRHRLGLLARDLGNEPIHTITTYDLEEWLTDHGYEKVTRRKFRALFHGFFEYALKRRLVKLNPANAIEIPVIDEKIPEILSVLDSEKLIGIGRRCWFRVA